jgi:hypothetical protein
LEQKHSTSLVKLVLSRRKYGLLQSVCPSQLYISISDRNERELASRYISPLLFPIRRVPDKVLID